MVDATADGAAVGDDGSDDDRAWARVGRLLRDLDRGRYARLYRIAEDIVAAYLAHRPLFGPSDAHPRERTPTHDPPDDRTDRRHRR